MLVEPKLINFAGNGIARRKENAASRRVAVTSGRSKPLRRWCGRIRWNMAAAEAATNTCKLSVLEIRARWKREVAFHPKEVEPATRIEMFLLNVLAHEERNYFGTRLTVSSHTFEILSCNGILEEDQKW